MINLLSRWIRNRARRRQNIWRFFDGRRWKWVDPYRIWRGIINHPHFNLADLPLIEQGEEPQTTIGIEAVCELFGIQRWSPERGDGLTDEEILAVLVDFLEYLEDLKKKRSPLQTWRPPTEPQSSAPPECPEPTMPQSAACGCSSAEPKPAKPAES